MIITYLQVTTLLWSESYCYGSRCHFDV